MKNVLTINVNVDFPALTAYVAYLQSIQQQQIDTLAEQVTTLTSSLANSNTGLQSSIDTTK